MPARHPVNDNLSQFTVLSLGDWAGNILGKGVFFEPSKIQSAGSRASSSFTETAEVHRRKKSGDPLRPGHLRRLRGNPLAF